MNWLRNWLAARRLKREWDREFRESLVTFIYTEALRCHIEDHRRFSFVSHPNDHDAHVAAYQAAPR